MSVNRVEILSSSLSVSIKVHNFTFYSIACSMIPSRMRPIIGIPSVSLLEQMGDCTILDVCECIIVGRLSRAMIPKINLVNTVAC